MWIAFFVAVVVGFLFLYVPGFLLLRACSLPRLTSILCAPLIVIPIYVLVGILLSKLDVFCAWYVMVLPVALVGSCALVVRSKQGFGNSASFGIENLEASLGRRLTAHWSTVCLGLCVFVGVCVSLYFYVGTLGSPDAFGQAFDNVQHLGVTHGFVESGNWSSLSVSMYPTVEDARVNPLPGSGFYPAAWNLLSALLVSALNVSAALAGNAVNFLFMAIVFPSSIFFLMAILFQKKPQIVFFSAFCALAFSAFPWGFLTFGPLYPNMIAFCLIPLFAGCFIAVFAEGVSRKARILALLLCFFGVMCFGFTQPNAVFTSAVFLIPFCALQATRLASLLPISSLTKKIVRIGFVLLFLLFAGLVWFALYRAPFMQGVVTHIWPGFTTFGGGLNDALSLTFRSSASQFMLALLVVVGILYSLKERKYLWLAFPFVAFCVMYAIAVSDGAGKHFLTGFWYTDSFRVAASAALCAIPLACMGLWVISSIVAKGVAKFRRKANSSQLVWSMMCTGVVFVCLNFLPLAPAPGQAGTLTAFGAVKLSLQGMNGTTDPRVYSEAEKSFVEEVERLVSPEALIINEPNDGSAFAYGVDGLNVYYRNLRTYGGEDETPESKIIRSQLRNIASHESVQRAVVHIGAEYVLVLDQGDMTQERSYLFTYDDGKEWTGIESIDDSTPGFHVVLSQGDMRLYRIAAA